MKDLLGSLSPRSGERAAGLQISADQKEKSQENPRGLELVLSDVIASLSGLVSNMSQ